MKSREPIQDPERQPDEKTTVKDVITEKFIEIESSCTLFQKT